jgi:hypothetical protein
VLVEVCVASSIISTRQHLQAYQLTVSLAQNFPQRNVHKTYPFVWRWFAIISPIMPHVVVSIIVFLVYGLYKPFVFVTGVVRHEIQNYFYACKMYRLISTNCINTVCICVSRDPERRELGGNCYCSYSHLIASLWILLLFGFVFPNVRSSEKLLRTHFVLR